MADALMTGDAAQGQALENSLGVRVDGTWVLTTAGLDQLVGSLGGIVLDVVSTAVTSADVAVPIGQNQTLDGVQAVAYATFLGGALRPAENVVRVLVQNGIGTPGLAEEARNRLVAAGLRYVGGGNAATLGRATSVVAVPSDTAEDRSRGLAAADSLGLPASAVAVGRGRPTLADPVVVLGADFAAGVPSTT